jgi:hypothetical protein
MWRTGSLPHGAHLSARPFTSEQNRARTLYAAMSAARIGRILQAVPTAAGSFGSWTESAALTISIKPRRIPLPLTIGELKHSGRRGEEQRKLRHVPCSVPSARTSPCCIKAEALRPPSLHPPIRSCTESLGASPGAEGEDNTGAHAATMATSSYGRSGRADKSGGFIDNRESRVSRLRGRSRPGAIRIAHRS